MVPSAGGVKEQKTKKIVIHARHWKSKVTQDNDEKGFYLVSK